MAASMDSDEEDSFVVIGKQVEQFVDDEPTKKKVSIHDLPVKDEKGRQRFHGAFTGGFSAGYFNSVGTKEGWAPSAFVSSRQSRTEHVSQRPEDFMDNDDFGEHGIAPRKIATSDSYTSEERQQKRKVLASAIAGDSIASEQSTLLDLVIPDSTSIGIRLLRKMGWKEGQGVGPRISSKERKKKKVYGCALPQASESDEGSDDDDLLRNITFAPKDCNPVSFDAKDNTHGIGYRGLNASVALPSGHINLFEPPAIGSSRRTGKRGIKGHGFGVGALEEEDDDIYSVDHLSNYDMTMGGEDKDHFSGWTAPKGLKQGYNSAHVGYVGKMLEGFTLSTKPLQPGKIYPPPNLPSHFKPIHRFKGPVVEESISGLNKTAVMKPSTATERAALLGETPVIVDSVFDLVSAEDREKMLKAKTGNLSSDYLDVSNEFHDKQKSLTAKAKSSRWDSMTKKNKDVPTLNVEHQDSIETRTVLRPSLSPEENKPIVEDTNISTAAKKPLFQGSLTGYKPFAKNPEKQERYEKYLSLVKLGHRDAYLQVSHGHLTEWERERERDEFTRAAKLYKPLSSMMASRFTTAKFDDEADSVDIPKEDEKDKTDKERAAEMKMFGQLTRENLEWHPDKTLCKRFNVPDPYTGSSIIGLPTVKRDKYSVYNFLSFPSQGPPESRSDERKPLAIEPKKADMESVMEEKEDNKSTSKISFNLKKKPSIFNVLFEEDSSSKSPVKPVDLPSEKASDQSETSVIVATVDTNEVETNKLQENIPNPVTMDLYRAIFQNSDSEDESSDNSNDEDNEDKPTVTTSQMVSNNASVVPSSSSRKVPSNPVPEISYQLPGDGSKIGTLTERLSASPKPVSVSSSSDVEMFGPALPNISADEKLKHAVKVHEQSFTPKHRFKKKHKDKYEERRKKKKKEKSGEKYKSNDKIKHKKSKHKKSKGKKSKKHKKESRRSGYDSDDSSSDSDDTQMIEKTLDIEILERMRGGPNGRSSAADFM